MGLHFPNGRTIWTAAFVAGAMAPSMAAGQINPGGGLNTNRYQQTAESRVLLLTTARGPDRRVAVQGTEQLTQQIRARIQARELYLLPKRTVDEVLGQSGFALDTALSPNDARLLGRALRADEYLDFYVEPNPSGRGFQMRGRLYLVQDPFLNDKLPDPEPGDQMRTAADGLVRALIEVRKQLPHERTCATNMAEGKYAEAEAAALQGIAAYPPATIVRRCLMAALSSQRKGPQAILQVARDVLAQDSLNRHGLAYAVDAYRELNDTANFVDHAARLVSVDITNAVLVENIVQTLAEMQRADIAIPAVERAIAVSPLEVPLHRLHVLLLISAERWEEAAERSEQLLMLDPEASDSSFYVRLAVAYRNDSQPERAADALGRGAAKFPQNAGLRVLYAQELNRTGKTQEAIAAYREAIEADPNMPGVRTLLASAFQSINQPDSTLAWLRKAHEAKEDPETIARMAYVIGGRYYQAANETKALEDFQKAVPALAFSDSVNATNDAKWLWSVAEFNIGVQAATKLQETPTCAWAMMAQKAFEIAPMLIRAGGGQVDSPNAGQIMTGIFQYVPFVEAKVTELCPPAR